jgi:predicted tellurium resistance membrane protein TerC
MDVFFSLDGLLSLLTLSFLEIILGIDNVIFIAILSEKVPVHQRKKARYIGLMLALWVRIALLFTLTWLIGLKKPLFSLQFLSQLGLEPDFSARDLILLAGGAFLVFQAVKEIVEKIKHHDPETPKPQKGMLSFRMAILQIIAIDVVFSFDSILTAVGLSQHLPIMIAAVVVAMAVMLLFADKISEFIHKFPTLKMLALCFLVLIGALLVLDAFGLQIPKGYVYTSIGFALFAEWLNLKIR